MNFEKYHFDIFVSLILMSTFGIVLLKMLVHFVFWLINERLHSNYDTLNSGFCHLYHVSSYSVNEFAEINSNNTEKYPDLKKHYERLVEAWNKYYKWPGKRVAEFFAKNLRFSNAEVWSMYCVLAFLAAFSGVVFLGISVSEFHKQSVLYDNGNYSGYVQYCDSNYKNIPLWETNAKLVIENAEALNNYYFDKQGNLNKETVCFILPESREDFKMIDTNAMYADFLKICEDKIEVLR